MENEGTRAQATANDNGARQWRAASADDQAQASGPATARQGRRGGEEERAMRLMTQDRRMPLKDKISLGPIEKYTIYNRFPYKLTLHILLLVLMSLTIQV